MSETWEVYWWEVSGGHQTLALAPTREEAERIAARLQPDGFEPSYRDTHGIGFAQIGVDAEPGPSAKWVLCLEWIIHRRPFRDTWTCQDYLVCPTGDEHYSDGGNNDYRAEVYAPTREAAAEKFRQRFGLPYSVDQAPPANGKSWLTEVAS